MRQFLAALTSTILALALATGCAMGGDQAAVSVGGGGNKPDTPNDGATLSGGDLKLRAMSELLRYHHTLDLMLDPPESNRKAGCLTFERNDDKKEFPFRVKYDCTWDEDVAPKKLANWSLSKAENFEKVDNTIHAVAKLDMKITSKSSLRAAGKQTKYSYERTFKTLALMPLRENDSKLYSTEGDSSFKKEKATQPFLSTSLRGFWRKTSTGLVLKKDGASIRVTFLRTPKGSPTAKEAVMTLTPLKDLTFEDGQAKCARPNGRFKWEITDGTTVLQKGELTVSKDGIYEDEGEDEDRKTRWPDSCQELSNRTNQ